MIDIVYLELAIKASECLKTVADVLSSEKECFQFCSLLKARLLEVTMWLQSLESSTGAEEEILELLRVLESFYQPCMSTVTDELTIATSEIQLRYPALAQLSNRIEGATSAIRTLSSDNEFISRRKRRQTLDDLKYCLPRMESNDNANVSPSDADLPVMYPPENGKAMTSLLHDSLSRHCVCNEVDAFETMVAHIRLRTNVHDDSGVSFGVLFMAHPHGPNGDWSVPENQLWWQDTLICVLKMKKRVKWEKSNDECEEIQQNSKESFCSLISNQANYGVFLPRFITTGETFVFQGNAVIEKEWEPTNPSISLARLLEVMPGRALTERNRNILAWLLSKAVWQYYSSPWMREPWNLENVHFLLETRTAQSHNDPGIFVDEPLLSISISSDKSRFNDTKTKSNVAGTSEQVANGDASRTPRERNLWYHQLPKLLSLGVMLLEILYWEPMKTQWSKPGRSRFMPHGKANINTYVHFCKYLIKQPDFISHVPGPFDALIRNCIDPAKHFMNHSRNEESVRNQLYLLIAPVEVFASALKPGRVEPLPRIVPRAETYTSADGSKRLQPGRTVEKLPSSNTDDWFMKMSSVNDILKAEDGENYQRVKIAVLDTGVKPNDVAAVHIKGYRDFVSENDGTKCDNTGHGTTSLNLVFQICHSAHVYAVRIFNTDQGDDVTLKLAIKAIDWCIQKKMDIICIPWGFSQSSQTLCNKIKEAASTMLIFAAPGNEGNASEIAFPARYVDHVFCMFSTNGAVRSSDLNPTQGPANHNFAILGEDIPTHNGVQKDGTSFSTAIAAGLAARLIDFSRHPDSGVSIEDALEMETKPGMTKVLLCMTAKEKPFKCIKPWELLHRKLRSQVPWPIGCPPVGYNRNHARSHIGNKITLAIDASGL